MTIISKAALAAELSVTKTRVSQYLKMGLPERADGKLDREVALHWISENLRSSRDHRKGPARARTLVPPTPTVKSTGDAEAARRALTDMAEQVAFYVMSTACDLDLPMKVVFSLVMNVQEGMADVLEEHLSRYGRSQGASLSLDPEVVNPEWRSIAEAQDEQFDIEAWQAYRADMHAKNGG